MYVSEITKSKSISKDGFKFFNICRHKDKYGNSTIVVLNKKIKNIYPIKYKAICMKCMKEFSLSQEEYERYKKGGDSKTV